MKMKSEKFDTFEEILEENARGDTNNIILGDWNNIVLDKSYRNIVGSHGLRRRNHRFQMLIDFGERNGLIVSNTWLKKPKKVCTRASHLEFGFDISSTTYL
jgi:hypothetical protein